MFLSIGMLKLNYFLADIFILSAEKQPIKLSWRKIECLRTEQISIEILNGYTLEYAIYSNFSYPLLKSYFTDSKKLL